MREKRSNVKFIINKNNINTAQTNPTPFKLLKKKKQQQKISLHKAETKKNHKTTKKPKQTLTANINKTNMQTQKLTSQLQQNNVKRKQNN